MRKDQDPNQERHFVAPYGNHIPRRRRSGQPQARTTVGIRPVVSLDAQALTDSATAFAESDEKGISSLPRLKAANAIAASANALLRRREFESELWERRKKAEAQIPRFELSAEQLDVRLRECGAELADLVAPLGLRSPCERQSLDFNEDEPASLEELAGEHGLPSPHAPHTKAQRTGQKLLIVLASGPVFGLSLGLLTGGIEIESIPDSWVSLLLFGALGSLLMWLVGLALKPVANHLGEELYLLSSASKSWRSLQTICNVVYLAALAISFILIESKVEQIGLLRAVTEQGTLESVILERTDLFWVSLMIALPVIATYVSQGICEGAAIANIAKLKSLRRGLRSQLTSRPEFASACSLHQAYRSLLTQREEIGSQLAAHRQQLEAGLSERQLQILEDMDMDAALASYAAEDLMNSRCRASGSERLRRQSFGPWRWMKALALRPFGGSAR